VTNRPILPAAVWASIAAGLLAAGGCSCPETIVPLDEIVRAYNTNADAVPRLWARAKIAVTLAPDDSAAPITWGSTSRLAAPNGLLLLWKGASPSGPHDFLLVGRETAAVELFRLGSSVEQNLYYFWFRFGDRGGAWFGRLDRAGAPGVKGLPIDPTQLLSVLSICRLPDDPTRLPTVAMGLQNKPRDCAYVLTYVDRQPVSGRILFSREVLFRWSDEPPRRPYQVNLLDAAGRRVLTAKLSDYRPIDMSDLDDPPAFDPVMPTDIEITCNRVAGVKTAVRRIHLVLSELTAADRANREAARFEPPAGIRGVQVDRHLGPTTRPKATGGGRE
jgi:hypothetical protein